jgi:DNA-binding XRE family transcriptional regulator
LEDQRNREDLAAALKSARLRHGFTYVALGNRNGHGTRWVADLENRSDSLHWRFDNVWAWGRAVGVDVGLEIEGIAPLSLLKIGPLARMSINDTIFGGVGLLEYLKTLRAEMGIEQREMARRLGVNHGSIWDVEESDNPKISSLQRYVRAMGGSLKFVLRVREPYEKVAPPF